MRGREIKLELRIDKFLRRQMNETHVRNLRSRRIIGFEIRCDASWRWGVMQRGISISHSCTASESCSLGFDMKQLRKCTDRSKKYYTTVMHYVTPFVATRDYVTYGTDMHIEFVMRFVYIVRLYCSSSSETAWHLFIVATAIINVSTTYRSTRTTSRIAWNRSSFTQSSTVKSRPNPSMSISLGTDRRVTSSPLITGRS